MGASVSGLELLTTAIAKAGYADKIKIGMDVAASEFYKETKYDLDFKNPKSDPADYVSAATVNSRLMWLALEEPLALLCVLE